MAKRIHWLKISDGSYENALAYPLRFDFKIQPNKDGGFTASVDDPFSSARIKTIPVATLEGGKDFCEDYLDKYGESHPFE